MKKSNYILTSNDLLIHKYIDCYHMEPYNFIIYFTRNDPLKHPEITLGEVIGLCRRLVYEN